MCHVRKSDTGSLNRLEDYLEQTYSLEELLHDYGLDYHEEGGKSEGRKGQGTMRPLYSRCGRQQLFFFFTFLEEKNYLQIADYRYRGRCYTYSQQDLVRLEQLPYCQAGQFFGGGVTCEWL